MPIQNNLRKKIIKSILDLLILQLIKDEPIPKGKILNEINSKFNVLLSHTSVYSALSSLKSQRLIAYTSNKLTLTKKGNMMTKRLIKDYFRLQKRLLLLYRNPI